MHQGILMAVLEAGAKLVLTDGTVWVTNPKDIQTTISWQPPALIRVDEKSSNREYDYTLTNTETKDSVTASRRK